MKQRKVKGWRREEEEKTRKRRALSHTGTDKSGRYDNTDKAHGITTKRETMPADDLTTSGSQKVDAIIELQQSYGNSFVQRMVNEGGKAATLDDELIRRIDAQRGSGRPLESGVTSRMESSLGHNFDNVRIHTDSEADTLSQNLNAKAFTVGKDIFFRQGVYEPASTEGTGIIAHELTHVVQQSGAPPTSPERITDIAEAAEIQANRTGQAIVSGLPIPVAASLETAEVIAREASETTPPSTSAEVSKEERIAEEDTLINNFYREVLSPLHEAYETMLDEEPNLSLANSRLLDAWTYLKDGIDWNKLNDDMFRYIFDLSTEINNEREYIEIVLNGNRVETYPMELGEYEATNIDNIEKRLKKLFFDTSDHYQHVLAPRYFARHR